MNWYKTLSITQRIAMKELCVDIVGVSWTDLGKLFTMRERINLIHQKLQMEGIL